MLTIYGKRTRFCDGISRRSFLRIGALSFGASCLTLTDILRAEAKAGAGSRTRSVINVFLGGGPPHQDMWDLKTEASSEIRGEFKPIATRVPGIDICEVFPKTARLMDKCAVIRSVVGANGRHDAYQCMSGWEVKDLAALGGRPSLGSVVARLQGPSDPAVPPFVGLAGPTKPLPWSDPGAPGFLRTGHATSNPAGPGPSGP